ncbi:MAG: UDP-N-acetylmuramoyl-L-alanine--D-glutamate ligase [Clostridia bacterium]|nr:UDP-N-acetylmuramoyl-L-alanine--D-glutamate ligase [Clostridia bacterium]
MSKKVLVIGMARSGLSAAKLLIHQGYHVTLNDSKPLETFSDVLEGPLKDATFDFGGAPKDIEGYDLVVLSPGVPTDLPFILTAKNNHIEVIGALELAYQNAKGNFYGITGTNGKTTTTTLTHEIFKADQRDAYAVGNIGNPLGDYVLDSHDQRDFITEISSFQLESIHKFHAHISAILNITPDHLNRHKTMEAYVEAKKRIFENQTQEDYLVLNYDDAPTQKIGETINQTQVVYFSKNALNRGVYVENGKIKITLDKTVEIMNVDEIFIPGSHNLENVLAAVAISYLAGIQPEVIRSAVMAFKGVEHRVEYVGVYRGVTCYNDSKATNPESSIVALKTMVKPTILIAGGMDKGSVFDEFVKAFENKIKHLILLGETKDLIEETARKYGYSVISKVADMEEAVDLAFEICEEGDVLLLSPACASWDMYSSFEVRGEHFKSCVMKRSK